MHEEACFLTFTYDDKHLPHGGTLDHRDIQLLLKRLRKYVSSASNKKQSANDLVTTATAVLTNRETNKQTKLRYYMCGEYGEKTQRAHYHMCLYGWTPKDQRFWATSGSSIKSRIYTSATLDKIWGKGKVYIGEVTFESAAYVARYIMKKVNGQRQKQHYERIDPETGEIINRKPEYTKMSLKPGIGAKWLEKYQSDVFPEGTVIARGHKGKSPKYYEKKFKKIDPLGYEDLLYERHKRIQPGENSKERLTVRETVAKAQIAFLKRNSI